MMAPISVGIPSSLHHVGGRHRDVVGEGAVAVHADDLGALAEVGVAQAALEAVAADDVALGRHQVAHGEEARRLGLAPSSTISPANSWPTTTGGLSRLLAQLSHSQMWRSVPQTPAWWTRIRTRWGRRWARGLRAAPSRGRGLPSPERACRSRMRSRADIVAWARSGMKAAWQMSSRERRGIEPTSRLRPFTSTAFTAAAPSLPIRQLTPRGTGAHGSISTALILNDAILAYGSSCGIGEQIGGGLAEVHRHEDLAPAPGGPRGARR